jgi:hypothetical protein
MYLAQALWIADVVTDEVAVTHRKQQGAESREQGAMHPHPNPLPLGEGINAWSEMTMSVSRHLSRQQSFARAG